MGVVQIKNDYLVSKANNLICANYDLSVVEQKIILTLASMVQPEDEDFKVYSFNIKEFNNMLGIKGSSKYTELKTITRELKKKVFEIKEGDDLLQLSWLGGVRYKNKLGIIDISLDLGLKPYLINLHNCFTQYKLQNILQLKSKYSIRLFEILKSQQWKNRSVIITIEDLKKMLGVTEKSYNLYTNFKQRVIDAAKKELEELTELIFDYEEIKTGRKITAIKFFIKKNENWQKSQAGEIFLQGSLLEDPEDIYKSLDNEDPKGSGEILKPKDLIDPEDPKDPPDEAIEPENVILEDATIEPENIFNEDILKKELKHRINNENSYITWIKPISFITEYGNIVLNVKNSFSKEIIENRYKSIIEESLKKLDFKYEIIEFKIEDAAE